MSIPKSDGGRSIRSVKDFVRRYFPSAVECPHCNGTGMIRGGNVRPSPFSPTRRSDAPSTREPRG